MKTPWSRSTATKDSGTGTVTSPVQEKIPAPEPVTVPVDPTAPKGRPTPKQKTGRAPVAPPPATSKEARARMRAKTKQQRADVRAGRAAPPEPVLTRRDAGPERKLVRDLVDSKRHIASFFPLFAVVLLVVYFVGSGAQTAALLNLVSLVWLVALVAIIIESIFLSRRVWKRVQADFPKTRERPFGLKMYAVMRALMFRRGRYPKPEVPLGAKV